MQDRMSLVKARILPLSRLAFSTPPRAARFCLTGCTPSSSAYAAREPPVHTHRRNNHNQYQFDSFRVIQRVDASR